MSESTYCIIVYIFPIVTASYLTDIGLCNNFRKSRVIGRIARSCVTYRCAVIYKHIIVNLITLRIIPAHKFVAASSCCSGADRHAYSISISITSESTYFIVNGVFPAVTASYLTNIGLCNTFLKSRIVGFYAFLCFHISVFSIRRNKIFAFVIPTNKTIAFICSRRESYAFTSCSVVGFTAVFIICDVVILVGCICYTCNFNRSALSRIRVTISSDVINLRNKRLQPTPLRHHGKPLVDIGIGFCFAVIEPGYTHILTIIIYVDMLG